jgi:hypothetical protein
MSFWKKFKKTMKTGGGMAKDVVGMMSHVPGPIGDAAKAVAPAAAVVSGMAKML